MTVADSAAWAQMRAALWPEASEASHARDVAEMLIADDVWGFIAETESGAPVGFVEVAVRNYANGCESQPVPFIEGIWVDERFRRRRVGRHLIEYVERFFAARGFSELGSDALLDNTVSQAAHTAWDFTETERVVYFRKDIKRG